MRRFILIMVIVTSGSIAIVRGQENNRDTEACTNIQLLGVSDTLSRLNWSEDYLAIASQIKEAPSPSSDDFTDIIDDTILFRQLWWDDIVPILPNCAIANKLALAGGRMVDNLLIMVITGRLAYLEAGETGNDDYLDAYQDYLDRWREASDELIALFGEMGDIADD